MLIAKINNEVKKGNSRHKKNSPRREVGEGKNNELIRTFVEAVEARRRTSQRNGMQQDPQKRRFTIREKSNTFRQKKDPLSVVALATSIKPNIVRAGDATDVWLVKGVRIDDQITGHEGPASRKTPAPWGGSVGVLKNVISRRSS